jgi:multidrug efflux pump subunit AcrA (membrane-fusion protein)
VYYISPVAADLAGGGIDLGNLIGGVLGGSRGVEARVRIPNPDLSITIGLDVDIAIELESRENVLRVPVSALRFCDEEQSFFVFVIDRSSRNVRQVFVEEGLFDNSGSTAWQEITSGLREGDEIMRAPPSGMRDGDRVRLV